MFCLRRNLNNYNQNKRHSVDQIQHKSHHRQLKKSKQLSSSSSQKHKTALPFNILKHINKQQQATNHQLLPPSFFSINSSHKEGFKSLQEKQEQRDEYSGLQKVRVNSLMLEQKSKEFKKQNVIFKTKNNKNKFDLKNFKSYMKQAEHNKNTTLTISDTSNKTSPEKQVKQHDLGRTNSILIMKRIQRKKQQLIQTQKQKYQEEFRLKKQVPIHHSQYHFNYRKRIKTEDVNDRRLQKADKLINEFRQTLNQQQPWKKNQTQDIEMFKLIKGQHIERFHLKASRSNYTKSFHIAKKKSSRIKNHNNKSQEQFDFGPWAKSFTAEIDHLF